jgi:amino acid efflux transporter
MASLAGKACREESAMPHSQPHSGPRSLERVITLPQAVALYVTAVLGAGVLLLPGLAATTAGPASMLAWAFDALLGAPLALTFAWLGARYPDAGGVATYATRAFGGGVGAAVGWMYLIGAAIGQIIVPLIGASYIAQPLGLGRNGLFLIAALILAIPIAANLRGLQVSGRAAMALSALVALLLLAAALVSLPRQRLAAWTPFAPHGWSAVGVSVVLLLFAFSGWEAVASLGAEFKRPERDIPRSVAISVAIITILYLAVAAATIGAKVYGSPALDSVSVALLLSGGLGIGATIIAAVVAVLVCVGTINAFIAGAARLGYALARDGAAPAWLAALDQRGTPVAAVLLIGLFAEAGLLVSWLLGLDANFWLALPNTLVLLTYILGMAAGARLLAGRARALAVVSLLLCLVALPFAGVSLWPALLIALAALAYRWSRARRRKQPQAS